MVSSWSEDCPSTEGWYFWRGSLEHDDQWTWCAFFVEGVQGEVTPWADGCLSRWPVGGFWLRIDTAAIDGVADVAH